MKIEAAGDAVDVEDFAGEVEAGGETAFHGFEMNLFERDSTAGDEFIFVGAFARDRIVALGEFLDEVLGGFFAELRPGAFLRNAGSLAESLPESFGEVFKWCLAAYFAFTPLLPGVSNDVFCVLI